MKPGRWFLREHTLYPPWLYYMLLIYDIPARFIFLLPFVMDGNYYTFMKRRELYSSITLTIEMFRRFIWLTIKCESEQLNNYESCRQIVEIPELKIVDEQEEEFGKV